jgi:hypothetical protein
MMTLTHRGLHMLLINFLQENLHHTYHQNNNKGSSGKDAGIPGLKDAFSTQDWISSSSAM